MACAKLGLTSSEQVFKQISAGFTNTALTVVTSISFATLAFTNGPASHLGYIIGISLLGSIFIRLIVAFFSSNPIFVGQVQDNPAAIMAVMVSSIMLQMSSSSERSQYVTLIAVTMVSTGIVGFAMLLLGRLRLGRFIRFVPYPVMGGFLAGTGWLLFTGGIKSITGIPISLDNANAYLVPEALIKWVPGLIVAVALLLLSRRYKHPYLIPGALAGAIVLFYVVLAIFGLSTDEALQRGLLLGPFPAGSLLSIPSPAEVLAVDWGLVFAQSSHIAVLLLISIIALLLNCSGIEIVVGENIDFNREMRAAGMANLAAAAVGSLPGYHGFSSSMLNYLLGAKGRQTAIVGVILMGAVLAAGAQVLQIFPKAVLGGLVTFLGLSLLVEWIIESFRKLPRSDYLIVVLILVCIIVFGHIEGVAVGIVAAAVLFLVQYSRQSPVKHRLTGDVYRSTVIRPPKECELLDTRGNEILVLQLHNYIFFGTANSIVEMVRSRVENDALPHTGYVILDFRMVPSVDSSAVQSFVRLRQLAKQHGFALVITELAPELAERIGGDTSAGSQGGSLHFFSELDRALEWCEESLLRSAGVEAAASDVLLEEHLKAHIGDEAAGITLRFLERRQLKTGSYLVHQGDEGGELFFVESGLLSVQLEVPGRHPMRVRTAKGGTILGEIGFYLHRKRTASIVADAPSTVYALSSSALEAMYESEPESAAAIHKYLARLLAERLSDNVALLNSLLT